MLQTISNNGHGYY